MTNSRAGFGEQISNLQVEDRVELIIVASTFMVNQHECALAWSKKKNRLLRPVTKLTTNSWNSGTFTVGLTYDCKVLNWNPESNKPHKSEDIVVKEFHILRYVNLRRPQCTKCENIHRRPQLPTFFL